jgi:hypothetical protein
LFFLQGRASARPFFLPRFGANFESIHDPCRIARKGKKPYGNSRET